MRPVYDTVVHRPYYDQGPIRGRIHRSIIQEPRLQFRIPHSVGRIWPHMSQNVRFIWSGGDTFPVLYLFEELDGSGDT